MCATQSDTTVFRPRTLGDLLALLSRKPDIAIYAGGTYILGDQNDKFVSLPKSLAYIVAIEDLSRIHRTERYFEIGACVTLSKLLQAGAKAIPSVLMLAIESIATSPVRNIVTIGGNICIPDRRLNTFPVLFLLDARVELRELGSARWVPISRIVGPEGNLLLAPTEVLTRIRIPLEDWTIQIYKIISAGPILGKWTISFCGLARTSRGVLTDFRFAFGSMGRIILRNREIEAEIVSRKLPLHYRDQSMICALFEESLSTEYATMISSHQRTMASKLFRFFISQLDLHSAGV